MKQSYFNLPVLLILLASTIVFGQVQVTSTSDYRTADQMLLANEINESGEPFAEELGYDLDVLDPFSLNSPDSISYTLGIENYEYSRYQLGTIISRSGLGLHMMWSPVIMEMSMMMPDSFDGSFTMAPNGFKEDDMLMKTIMHFSMISNQPPPGNPWPQFADFAGGDPHLPGPIDAEKFDWEDFSTLRWDRSKMDMTLSPAAMGQSLMKQYLWAQDMEGSFHDSSDNGIEPDGIVTPDSAGNPHFDPNNNVYHGGDALDGFVGLVLTAEAINKVKFILSTLAFDGTSLGMVDPMTYNPASGIKYFPGGIEVTEAPVADGLPPKASAFTVTDSSSYLFDQFSLLWGTLHFKNMMDPDNNSSSAHLAYHTVFDGDPFPAPMSETGMPGPFDLMKGASAVIFANVLAMHFNGTEGTFVDESHLSGGEVVQGTKISTVNAGYILVALKTMLEEFPGMGTDITNAIVTQADYILGALDAGTGYVYNGYMIGTGPDSSPYSAMAHAAAIRGLYAAYLATNDNKYKTKADEWYDSLIANYYLPEMAAFRTTDGEDLATYTPKNFAIIAGALREASMVGGKTEAPAIYTRFFKKVANSMQLSEGEQTGESGADSDGDGIPFIPEQADNLPPVFASEATLDFTVTAIDDDFGATVKSFKLGQNYPNPFNPSTTIDFRITKSGNYTLSVYNVAGQLVSKIFSRNLTAKEYSINFNARNLSSGTYFYQLSGVGFRSVQKFTLLK